VSCKFKTFQIADIGTEHVAPQDLPLLDDHNAPFSLAELHNKAGVIFWVPTKDAYNKKEFEKKLQELDDFGFSGEFQEIFRQLRKQGIPYVRFDADGGTIKGAPTFD
jgi:hypothetical protein